MLFYLFCYGGEGEEEGEGERGGREGGERRGREEREREGMIARIPFT